MRAGLRHEAKMADELHKSGDAARSAKVAHDWVQQLLAVGPGRQTGVDDDPWDALAAHLSDAEMGDPAHARPSD